MRLGYVRKSSPLFSEEKRVLKKQNYDQLVIGDRSDISELECFKEALAGFNNCTVVVYSEESITEDGSITNKLNLLEWLKSKNIELILLDYPLKEEISSAAYLKVVYKLAIENKKAISYKTAKGLKEARAKGHIGGRPKISEKTIKEINHLYTKEKYTLREVAEKVNVSLGTVYKYTELIKKGQLKVD